MRNSNKWQANLYSDLWIEQSIGSPSWNSRSALEAQFIEQVLDLKRGAKILDVPCGAGRITKRLAQRGYDLTGVDLNADCIKLAKEKFSHKDAAYRLGDMADLTKYRAQFDALINVFTSFGYFATDRENQRVFQQLKRCLRPGGKLLITLTDRVWIEKNLREFIKQPLSKKHTLYNCIDYDRKTRYVSGYFFIVENGTNKSRTHYFRHRLYSKPEVFKLYKEAGFVKVKVFGDFAGRKYVRGESRHPIFVGQVPNKF